MKPKPKGNSEADDGDLKVRERKKPGPKPVTVSLYPLTPELALSAFMQVDPKKVKAAERKVQKKGR